MIIWHEQQPIVWEQNGALYGVTAGFCTPQREGRNYTPDLPGGSEGTFLLWFYWPGVQVSKSHTQTHTNTCSCI